MAGVGVGETRVLEVQRLCLFFCLGVVWLWRQGEEKGELTLRFDWDNKNGVGVIGLLVVVGWWVFWAKKGVGFICFDWVINIDLD